MNAAFAATHVFLFFAARAFMAGLGILGPFRCLWASMGKWKSALVPLFSTRKSPHGFSPLSYDCTIFQSRSAFRALSGAGPAYAAGQFG